MVFSFQKSIIVTEIALGDDNQFQDTMPSRFNTPPVVTGGWMDDDIYTMQFMP